VGDAIVWVDVALANEAWRKDRDYFLDGPIPLAGKMGRFDAWVRAVDQPVEMAEVCLTADGRLSFTNGRHRFAWMRDRGAKALPVCIDPEAAKRASDAMGTQLRQTLLPDL
jgi:hypothetical protein